jgi:hypothetical protein
MSWKQRQDRLRVEGDVQTLIQIGTMKGAVVLAGNVPTRLLDHIKEQFGQQPVRITFTNVSARAIDFTITNVSAVPVQVTSIFGLPFSKLKFETRSIRENAGPRYRLSLELRDAQSGRRYQASAGDRVYNLGPYESDAFSLEVASENLLWLFDLEAVVVTPVSPDPVLVRSEDVILYAAASDRFAGHSEAIKKKVVLDRLLALPTPPLTSDAVQPVAVELIDLFARGAAFVADSDARSWVRLRSIYELTDTWGSILASFAEYGTATPLSPEITSYIGAWLRDPQAIKRVSIWDNESRARTVLRGYLSGYQGDAKVHEIIKILDETAVLQFSEWEDDVGSDDRFMKTFLAGMSLSNVRDEAGVALGQLVGRQAVEVLIASQLTGEVSAEEQLWELTGQRIGDDTYLPQKKAAHWFQWWAANKGPKYRGPDLRLHAPRLTAALAARTSAKGFGKFVSSTFPIVRAALAANPACPEAELLALTRDPVPEVRRLVAIRQKLQASVARILARDTNPVVRRNLSSNGDCTIDVLRLLSNDEDGIVRESIAKRLG